MKTLPLTIAIATYNRAHYLRQTLQSIVGSDARPLEVLVLDDGSKDNSAQEITKSCSIPIQYFYQQNQGPATSRNILAEKAAAPYILFLDDDDLLEPDALSCLCSTAEQHNGTGVVYSQYTRIDAEVLPLPSRLKRKNYPSGLIFPTLFQMNLILPSATLIPVQLIRRKKLRFNPSLRINEDYQFFLRLALDTPFFAINRPLIRRRRHQNNLSKRSAATAALEYQILKDFYEKTPEAAQQISPDIYKKRLAELLLREAKATEDTVQKLALNRKALHLSFSWKALFRSIIP